MLGIEALNITGMGASARERAWGGVAGKRGLNRKIRASLWGFTQDRLKRALEAHGGQVLKLPTMDSSRTCAKCGHVDAKSRNSRQFKYRKCGHTANADVNAVQVLRTRARRRMVSKAQGLTGGEASQTLWKALRTARKTYAGDAGVRAKLARNATGEQRYKRGAGTPDSACQGTTEAQGWKRSSDAGPRCGHEGRSV